jgi:activating signal cointegrator complex subunit 3
MRCIFSQDHPLLENKRRELIESAARALDKARMVRFEPRTGDLNVIGSMEIT